MTYRDETYMTLRNCRLLPSVLGEVDFVRCVPVGASDSKRNANPKADNAGVISRRVAAEVAEKGVSWSWHPDYGDYVRVNVGTQAYRLICHMLS